MKNSNSEAENNTMKGQQLPMNMIVVVAIAVVAIAAVGAFLLSGSLGNISNAEAQRIFSTGCARYCDSDLYGTFQNAYEASKSDPDFANACVKLGYIKESEKSLMNRCFNKCGNCNLNVQNQDLAAGLDILNAQTTK